jgi:hypothetical protein
MDALGFLLTRVLSQESRQIDAFAVASRHAGEHRMMGQLAELAARWGRSRPEGTVIALDISSDVLGRLSALSPGIASRVVRSLDERGVALDRQDGTWLLRGPATLDVMRDTLTAASARASEAPFLADRPVGVQL